MKPVIQRQFEAMALLAFATFCYHLQEFSWTFFALAFFIPDLSVLAYLVNSRVGGIAYNAAHFMLFPFLLAGCALMTGGAMLLQIALVWIAHIAFDRSLGWGLKYPDSFFNTDMGVKSLPFGLGNPK